MVRALRVIALVWAIVAVAVVLVATMGAFLTPGSVWHRVSMTLLATLSVFNARVNSGVLVLMLPAVAAALGAAWLNRGGATLALDADQFITLTRNLQEAAAATAVTAGRSFESMLEQFFDREADGTMVPKAVRVRIDETRHVLVPLVSLVPKVGFTLDTMRVRFRCGLRGRDATGQSLADRLGRLGGGAITVRAVPNQRGRTPTLFDVTLEFRPGEPPDAVTDLLRELEPSVVTVNGEHGEAGRR